jgi:hypothetical protein
MFLFCSVKLPDFQKASVSVWERGGEGEGKEVGSVFSFVSCEVRLDRPALRLRILQVPSFCFIYCFLANLLSILLPLSGSNLDMFRCKVNKTVSRMDINGCFFNVYGNFILLYRHFEKFGLCSKLKEVVREFMMSWGGGT